MEVQPIDRQLNLLSNFSKLDIPQYKKNLHLIKHDHLEGSPVRHSFCHVSEKVPPHIGYKEARDSDVSIMARCRVPADLNTTKTCSY